MVVKKVRKVKNAGRTKDDFRGFHDKSYIVPKKIREGLEQLGEAWEYESDFMRRCGLSTTDFSRYRDQFEEYIVNTTGKSAKRVWAGTEVFAAELREMVQ